MPGRIDKLPKHLQFLKLSYLLNFVHTYQQSGISTLLQIMRNQAFRIGIQTKGCIVQHLHDEKFVCLFVFCFFFFFLE